MPNNDKMKNKFMAIVVVLILVNIVSCWSLMYKISVMSDKLENCREELLVFNAVP